MRDVRTSIGAGNTRERIIRQVKRSLTPSIIALIAVAGALITGGFMILHIDRTALVSSRKLAFALEDANGVVPKVDEVRFRGIPAGKIDSVTLHDGQPMITVSLEKSYGKVYRDAHATLRPNTPLQDMYLDILDPGTPAAGAASDTSPVPAAQTDTSVSISAVLDVFQGDERARLGHLLDDFGNGLDDRGAALRTAFADLVPLVQTAGHVTSELDANQLLTRRLVHNVGTLTTTLGDRETQLRRLVAQGASTLATVQQGNADLDQTLHLLPGTLTAADESFSAVRGVLGNVDGALGALRPVSAKLPSSLASVRHLATVATPTVIRLAGPVRQLVPLARVLQPASASLSQSVSTLLPQIPALAHTVDAVSDCLPSLNGFFKWDASMAKFGDSSGPAPRGNVVAGGQAVGASNSFEQLEPSCAPGQTIRGRSVQPGDRG